MMTPAIIDLSRCAPSSLPIARSMSLSQSSLSTRDTQWDKPLRMYVVDALGYSPIATPARLEAYTMDMATSLTAR